MCTQCTTLSINRGIFMYVTVLCFLCCLSMQLPAIVVSPHLFAYLVLLNTSLASKGNHIPVDIAASEAFVACRVRKIYQQMLCWALRHEIHTSPMQLIPELVRLRESHFVVTVKNKSKRHFTHTLSLHLHCRFC